MHGPLANVNVDRGLYWWLRMIVSCAFLTFLFVGGVSYCEAQELELRSGKTFQNFREWQNPCDGNALDGDTVVLEGVGHSRSLTGAEYNFEFPEMSETEFGIFKLREDGNVCVDVTNGNDNCDLLIRKNELLLLRQKSGGRFPMMLELGVKP